MYDKWYYIYYICYRLGMMFIFELWASVFLIGVMEIGTPTKAWLITQGVIFFLALVLGLTATLVAIFKPGSLEEKNHKRPL